MVTWIASFICAILQGEANGHCHTTSAEATSSTAIWHPHIQQWLESRCAELCRQADMKWLPYCKQLGLWNLATLLRQVFIGFLEIQWHLQRQILGAPLSRAKPWCRQPKVSPYSSTLSCKPDALYVPLVGGRSKQDTDLHKHSCVGWNWRVDSCTGTCVRWHLGKLDFRAIDFHLQCVVRESVVLRAWACVISLIACFAKLDIYSKDHLMQFASRPLT